jgi:hypothetical protein
VRDRDREDAEYDDEVPLYPFVAGTYVQYAMDSMEPDIYADETGSCAADSKLCRYNRSFVVSFTATGRTDYSGAGLDPAELGAIGRPLRVTALFGSDLTAITHDESITLLVDGTMRRYHVDIPQGLMNEDKKLIGLRFASGEELGTFSVGAVEVAIGTTHHHHRLFHDPDTGARTGGVFLNGGAEAWDVSDVVGVPYEVAPFDAAILRYDGAAWFDVTTGASLSTDTGG